MNWWRRRPPVQVDGQEFFTVWQFQKINGVVCVS